MLVFHTLHQEILQRLVSQHPHLHHSLPVLLVQGHDDEYGTMAQLDAIGEASERAVTAANSATAEEEEEIVGDDRTDGVERLQPRRPDETQCTHCFLLVRQNAPGCPVEDDACPLFKTA